jgi:hypothetical protein
MARFQHDWELTRASRLARAASGNDYRAIEQRERGPPSAWNAVSSLTTLSRSPRPHPTIVSPPLILTTWPVA